MAVRAASLTAVVVAAASLLEGAGEACAQEMEPRTYAASPIGTNFLGAGYLRTTGDVSPVPSLPITDVKASLNAVALGYARTFDLLGQTGSAAIALPYVEGKLSGNVGEESRKIFRSGLGDLGLRFAANLFGSPALTPAEFAQREPTTTLGVSLAILAPTGNYDPQHLVNISANRWAFKPEIGLSQPIGDWFADATAGVWLFTNNNDFFGGNVRSQDPLWLAQLHGGYNFRPGLWLAVDGAYYTGGRTSVNGVAGNDVEVVARYGFTLSLPLLEGLSAKLAWSTWLSARNSGSYDTLGVAIQYRWFDD